MAPKWEDAVEEATWPHVRIQFWRADCAVIAVVTGCHGSLTPGFGVNACVEQDITNVAPLKTGLPRLEQGSKLPMSSSANSTPPPSHFKSGPGLCETAAGGSSVLADLEVDQAQGLAPVPAAQCFRCLESWTFAGFA